MKDNIAIMLGVSLLLLANRCQANIMWFYESSDDKISPVFNFAEAMEGYDAVMGDPFTFPDPGKRKSLFNPLFKESGRTYLRSFVDKIEKKNECDKEFNTLSISNAKQFMTEKSKGYTYFIDSESMEGYRSGSVVKERDFDDVIYGRANCITATVDIALFEKPVFTEKFQNALTTLYHASKKPRSERSKTTAVAFFRTFGTHFLRSSKLGSKIIFWDQFSGDTATIKKNDFEKCITSVVNKGFAESNANNSILKEIFATNSLQCRKHIRKNRNIDLHYEIIKNNGIAVMGNLPNSSMNDWFDEANKSPVPVSFELMKISYFFRNEWLDFIHSESEGNETLNTEFMYNFFEENLEQYCRRRSGRRCFGGQPSNSIWESKSENSIENFLNDEITDNDVPHVQGARQSRTGKQVKQVIVSGGFSAMQQDLSSVEVLTGGTDSRTISDLPARMGGHSLTAIGSVLYNCGGSTPWNVSIIKNACYVQDTASSNPSWSHKFDLPKNIKNFHTAIALELEIWLFNRGSSLLHILDTTTGSLSFHQLPFTMGNHMCINNYNNTTLISVDTNTGNIYTLDHIHYPEKWNQDKIDIETRFNPICLNIGSELFITGNKKVNESTHFDVVNVENSNVTKIATFVYSRTGYGLFELDGSPAVVGGMHLKDNEVLSSIERFDSTRDEWLLLNWNLTTPRVYFALAQMIG